MINNQEYLIDSHVHFWKYDASHSDFSWIDNTMDVLKKDFLPANFPTLFHKKYSCVAVQARQNIEETYFLLDLADKFSFVSAVVGWVDYTNPSIEKQYQELSNYNKLKGFRHIIQAEPNGFMTNELFQNSIQLLGDCYTYDLLLKPHQLKEALVLVQRFPEIKFVIDHLAKPNFKENIIEQWKEEISYFKSSSNVYCKLSGMVTESDWNNWEIENFRSAVTQVIEVFGEDRLMYGSDWPVCLLAAEYDEVYQLFNDLLLDFSEEAKHKVLFKNAMNFYKI